MAEDMNTAYTADADDWSDITADSFADVEDDAQGAPDTETQGNDAAPEIEQNDGGQDADAAQPGKNEEQQAQTDGQLFELKHLGETKNVNRDEVVTLAQKGMDYDRVTEKNTQLETRVSNRNSNWRSSRNTRTRCRSWQSRAAQPSRSLWKTCSLPLPRVNTASTTTAWRSSV